MADNKNMELNDEMMANATGGTDGASGGEPKFKVGDYVHYELTNPQTGQTMAINGTITSYEFLNEINMNRYTINPDPNEYNVTELQAREDRIRYA